MMKGPCSYKGSGRRAEPNFFLSLPCFSGLFKNSQLHYVNEKLATDRKASGNLRERELYILFIWLVKKDAASKQILLDTGFLIACFVWSSENLFLKLQIFWCEILGVRGFSFLHGVCQWKYCTVSMQVNSYRLFSTDLTCLFC